MPSTTNDFVVSVVPTYTISGSISINTNVSNVTSVTAVVNTGTCTIIPPNGANGWSQQNKTGSYICSVLGGSNILSIAISPTCSNTTTDTGHHIVNAFKQYTLS
jgi:hypothetical protein